MTATMLINQTKNAFQERNENTIQPFYQDSGAMFYKNKLINVEDIVEHYEMNTDDNNEFEAYSSKIFYLLTFEDERGNTDKYISSVKPKNIGALYYYVIKDDKLENIFPEKDRKKLKPYISTNSKYEYNNKRKIYILTSFIEKHIIKISIALWISLTVFMVASILNDHSIGAYIFSSMFAFFPTALIGVLMNDSADSANRRFKSKENIFIEQKENEEIENILKNFI